MVEKHPIRLWRERDGMKQGFLASRLGIAHETLSRIERWRQRPSRFLAIHIATFTGLSLDDVLKAKPDAP